MDPQAFKSMYKGGCLVPSHQQILHGCHSHPASITARVSPYCSIKVENMISKKIVLLSLIPIVTVGAYIYFFGLNMPFWDQWENVSLLIKQQQGNLSIADLFTQHDEHRPFFPRLIWIGLAELTHYNVKAEQWTNLFIALATFGFFIHRSIRLWRE